MPPFRRTDSQENPHNPGDEPETDPRSPKDRAQEAKQAEEDRGREQQGLGNKTVIGPESESQVGGMRPALERDGFADPYEPNDPDRVDQRPDLSRRGMDERPSGGAAGASQLPPASQSPSYPTSVSPQTPLSADTFGAAPGPGNPPARPMPGGAVPLNQQGGAVSSDEMDRLKKNAIRAQEQRDEELRRGNERIEDERRDPRSVEERAADRKREEDRKNS